MKINIFIQVVGEIASGKQIELCNGFVTDGLMDEIQICLFCRFELTFMSYLYVSYTGNSDKLFRDKLIRKDFSSHYENSGSWNGQCPARR